MNKSEKKPKKSIIITDGVTGAQVIVDGKGDGQSYKTIEAARKAAVEAAQALGRSNPNTEVNVFEHNDAATGPNMGKLWTYGSDNFPASDALIKGGSAVGKTLKQTY